MTNRSSLLDSKAMNQVLDSSSEAASFEFASLILFWISAVLCFVMGMLSSFGNGLVFYLCNKKNDFGGYREVNWVVKNLALSDMLFGLVGSPLTIVYWTWGKIILNLTKTSGESK